MQRRGLSPSFVKPPNQWQADRRGGAVPSDFLSLFSRFVGSVGSRRHQTLGMKAVCPRTVDVRLRDRSTSASRRRGAVEGSLQPLRSRPARAWSASDTYVTAPTRSVAARRRSERLRRPLVFQPSSGAEPGWNGQVLLASITIATGISPTLPLLSAHPISCPPGVRERYSRRSTVPCGP